MVLLRPRPEELASSITQDTWGTSEIRLKNADLTTKKARQGRIDFAGFLLKRGE
jgi:hypothetical protein